MKHSLIYYGNPTLRKQAKPLKEVTEETRALVKEMVKIMNKHNGIGLAAPQVGVSSRLFITCVPKEDEQGEWIDGTLRVFINPKIESLSDKREIDQEGCLSIPKIFGHVERPLRVTVSAQDIEGKPFKITLEGLEARCVLHENDHINGVLFIDRIDKKERNQIDKDLRELKKQRK
ncbi:MAG: peptide deformylase [Waddliaceae bacterium]